MNESPKFPLPRDRDMKAMSLRDYFAAKAMQAYARCSNAWEKDEIARQSWIMADAMLKAREK